MGIYLETLEKIEFRPLFLMVSVLSRITRIHIMYLHTDMRHAHRK